MRPSELKRVGKAWWDARSLILRDPMSRRIAALLFGGELLLLGSVCALGIILLLLFGEILGLATAPTDAAVGASAAVGGLGALFVIGALFSTPTDVIQHIWLDILLSDPRINCRRGSGWPRG